jgi:hypothetical protein
MAGDKAGESLGDLMGRFFSKGKTELEKVARKGRDHIHIRQLKNDRDKLYQKLGREARNLLDAGEIKHPGLEVAIERILELEKRIQEAEDAVRAGEQVNEDASESENTGESSEG